MVATEDEEAVKDGRTRWDCILSYNEEASEAHCSFEGWWLTKGPEEMLDHWYQHFKKYLMSGVFMMKK